MMQSLGQQQRRQVAVAILVAIVAVLLSITVLPVWLANASRQDTLDQLQQRLSQYERIAAQDSDLLPQFKELKQAQLSAGNYLKSNTVAVAGAELQRMVKDITAANRADDQYADSARGQRAGLHPGRAESAPARTAAGHTGIVVRHRNQRRIHVSRQRVAQ